jgi:hypothetical protein
MDILDTLGMFDDSSAFPLMPNAEEGFQGGLLLPFVEGVDDPKHPASEAAPASSVSNEDAAQDATNSLVDSFLVLDSYPQGQEDIQETPETPNQPREETSDQPREETSSDTIMEPFGHISMRPVQETAMVAMPALDDYFTGLLNMSVESNMGYGGDLIVGVPLDSESDIPVPVEGEAHAVPMVEPSSYLPLDLSTPEEPAPVASPAPYVRPSRAVPEEEDVGYGPVRASPRRQHYSYENGTYRDVLEEVGVKAPELRHLQSPLHFPTGDQPKDLAGFMAKMEERTETWVENTRTGKSKSPIRKRDLAMFDQIKEYKEGIEFFLENPVVTHPRIVPLRAALLTHQSTIRDLRRRQSGGSEKDAMFGIPLESIPPWLANSRWTPLAVEAILGILLKTGEWKDKTVVHPRTGRLFGTREGLVLDGIYAISSKEKPVTGLFPRCLPFRLLQYVIVSYQLQDTVLDAPLDSVAEYEEYLQERIEEAKITIDRLSA